MKKINGKHSLVAIAAVAIVLGLAFYAIFGGRTRRDIIGTWVMSVEGTNRGFQCGTRGIAASINIDTLQYTNWELHGKSLILKGKRFANRHVFDIADTLPIRKINASTMVVASGNSTHTYHKIR